MVHTGEANKSVLIKEEDFEIKIIVLERKSIIGELCCHLNSWKN